jgi:hypothetical protein
MPEPLPDDLPLEPKRLKIRLGEKRPAQPGGGLAKGRPTLVLAAVSSGVAEAPRAHITSCLVKRQRYQKQGMHRSEYDISTLQ